MLSLLLLCVIGAFATHPHYVDWSDDMKAMYLNVPRSTVDANAPVDPHFLSSHTCAHSSVANTTMQVDPQNYEDVPPHKRQTSAFRPFRVKFAFDYLGNVGDRIAFLPITAIDLTFFYIHSIDV